MTTTLSTRASLSAVDRQHVLQPCDARQATHRMYYQGSTKADMGWRADSTRPTMEPYSAGCLDWKRRRPESGTTARVRAMRSMHEVMHSPATRRARTLEQWRADLRPRRGRRAPNACARREWSPTMSRGRGKGREGEPRWSWARSPMWERCCRRARGEAYRPTWWRHPTRHLHPPTSMLRCSQRMRRHLGRDSSPPSWRRRGCGRPCERRVVGTSRETIITLASVEVANGDEHRSETWRRFCSLRLCAVLRLASPRSSARRAWARTGGPTAEEVA
jgi:hypothetical protein